MLRTAHDEAAPLLGRSEEEMLLTSLALVVAAIGLGDRTAHRAQATQAKPTVVLIHGGWAD